MVWRGGGEGRGSNDTFVVDAHVCFIQTIKEIFSISEVNLQTHGMVGGANGQTCAADGGTESVQPERNSRHHVFELLMGKQVITCFLSE